MQNNYINTVLYKIMFKQNSVNNWRNIDKNTMRTKLFYRLSHRERKRKLRFVKGKMYAFQHP